MTFDNEERVIIHNAVIFMANDLMEEIQELERWIENGCNSKEVEKYREELAEKKRRWDVMLGITEKVKKERDP